jgi:hypothetical protein
MIIKILVFILIYVLVVFSWNVVEKVLHGKVTPKTIDDVVALVLTISIYNNIY